MVSRNSRSASAAAPSIASSRSKRTGLDPGPIDAVLRDQVDVLEDHDGGLQVARQLGDRADRDQRAAGEHQPGVAGHLAEQVAGRVRLAGARRAVEQQAALEVLARGEQRRPVRGDPEGVPLHPGQHGLRQHHVVAASAGGAAKPSETPPIGVSATSIRWPR